MEADRCFIVRDADRQALAYVYLEEESGRQAAAHLLTRDEARRIAACEAARLPRRCACVGSSARFTIRRGTAGEPPFLTQERARAPATVQGSIQLVTYLSFEEKELT